MNANQFNCFEIEERSFDLYEIVIEGKFYNDHDYDLQYKQLLTDEELQQLQALDNNLDYDEAGEVLDVADEEVNEIILPQ